MMNTKMKLTVKKIVIFFVAVYFLQGCVSFGPKTILRDRFGYTTVLSDSWKDQMLLNIVRLRYGDVPIFLDVASVINSYEISGKAGLAGNMAFVPNFGSNANVDVSGTYANRPTITYTPLSGDRFAKSLMSSLPVSSILSLIQSGFAADLVLRIFVQSINGFENRLPRKNYNDPTFYHLINTLKEIQDAGAVGLRIEKEDNNDLLNLVFKNTTDKVIGDKIAEFKDILGLDTEESEFKVTYGILPLDNKGIVIISRSMLQVLNELSYYIEVPVKDVEDNRVNPTFTNIVVDGESVPPLVKIHYAFQPPEDAFVSVPYHNCWFWIDNKDLRTKQVFSSLMFSFTLVETGYKDEKPLITVPVR
jgi:hypothetical protein